MSQQTQVVINDEILTPEFVQKLVIQNPMTGYAVMSMCKDDVVVAKFREATTAFIQGILKSYHEELRNNR